MPEPMAPDLVRRARSRIGWTQQQLATEVGVTRAAVANWESGVSDLPATTLLRLIDLAGWAVVEVVRRGGGDA